MNARTVSLYEIERIERLARQMRAEMTARAVKRMVASVKSAFGGRRTGRTQTV